MIWGDFHSWKRSDICEMFVPRDTSQKHYEAFLLIKF